MYQQHVHQQVQALLVSTLSLPAAFLHLPVLRQRAVHDPRSRNP